MNRSARRLILFDHARDYEAFERVLCQASSRFPMRLLAYVVMPNHWHLVVWPEADEDLPRYMKWVTMTHALRWHADHGTSGIGAVYQGRYKARPVQRDGHFLTVCRYVARNPVRAGLVDCAREWRWSSSHPDVDRPTRPQLQPWPVSMPPNWSEWLKQPESASAAPLPSAGPVGTPAWCRETAGHLSLTLRTRGRPVSGGRN
jgi:putative transposase